MDSVEPPTGTSEPSPKAPAPSGPYDVFISYSHHDADWTHNNLRKRLEAHGVRVRIDSDFAIGSYSVAAMEEAVRDSRHTLAVLTPQWVESQWASFEGLLAVTEAPLRRKLLPLLLRECKLPIHIQALVRADFTDPGKRDAEFAKLLRAISATAAASPPIAGDAVRQGLVALGDLLQEPRVREAVVAFKIHFQRVGERSGMVSGYKDLHDLLHTLQLHCFEPLVREGKRFPDDDAVENVCDHERTLRSTLDELRRVARRARLPAELTWIDRDVDPALNALRAALAVRDPDGLRRTVALLNRVLSRRPAEVNARLGDAARDLPLADLAAAMKTVSDGMQTLQLDADKVQAFSAGVETLDRLRAALADRVADHDRWQEIDQELRLWESSRDDSCEASVDSWLRIQASLAPVLAGLAGDLWLTPLLEQRKRLDDAVTAKDPLHIRIAFRGFRREAAIRFHQVDTMLKDQCEELRTVAESLNELVEKLDP